MHKQVRDYLSGFARKPGASPETIQTAVELLNFSPPDDYVEIIGYMDGGEGFVESAYLRLYPIEELQGLNRAFAVDEFAPGLVIFGSTGGGEAFAFDTRANPVLIVQVPFIPLLHEYAVIRGETFADLVTSLAGVLGEAPETGSHHASQPVPDPQRAGKELHYVHPVAFGGDPRSHSNRVFLDTAVYAKYVCWWNRLYNQVRAQQAN